MTGPALHKTAADRAEELPGAREPVTESYRLVVAHLPKAEQPVGPHTYAGGTRASR